MASVTEAEPRSKRRLRLPAASTVRRVPGQGHRGLDCDTDYWIAHCEGYHVDSCDGRLGFVDEVRRMASGELILVVRAGRLGRRLLLVPVREIQFIVPRAERIWLRSSAIVATEPLRG